MDLNKVGRDVDKTADGLSSRLLGIMKHSKSPYFKIRKENELVRTIYSDVGSRKISAEVEFKRSRAFFHNR